MDLTFEQLQLLWTRGQPPSRSIPVFSAEGYYRAIELQNQRKLRQMGRA